MLDASIFPSLEKECRGADGSRDRESSEGNMAEGKQEGVREGSGQSGVEHGTEREVEGRKLLQRGEEEAAGVV